MFFLLLLGILAFNVFSINAVPEFTLMIGLYNETVEARCKEYIQCLQTNLANAAIKQVHILYDISKDKKSELSFLDQLKQIQALSQKPIVITYINDRQTFKGFFDIANQYYPEQNIIVANADIYFDETLLFLDGYNLQGKLLALTRWEPYPRKGSLWKHCCIPNQPLSSDSQDVWILRTPITIKNADIKLGTIGCDPNIAYEAADSGLEVINPCLTIKAYHLHHSQVRHYNPKAPYNTKRAKMLMLETLY